MIAIPQERTTKYLILFILAAVFFLSACSSTIEKNIGSSATSTGGAGSQQGFIATIVAQTLTSVVPTPTNTPTATATSLPLSICKDSFFGIQITLPNDTWTCTIEPYTDNNGTTVNEWITLQSPLFTVIVSNLGRGSYCGDGPDQTGCDVTEFHKNLYVTLSNYRTEGKLREIFGVTDRKFIIDGAESYIWFSVKYNDMETRELTISETQELFQLLDSITFTTTSISNIVWIDHIIDLYGATVSAPINWQIEEVNRRPEPIDPYYTYNGHDCADYEIKSPDGFTIIHMDNVCGFGDASLDKLPDGAVVINPNDEDRIARYPVEENKYMYAHTGVISGIESNYLQNGDLGIYDQPIFQFGDGLVNIQFEYRGTKDHISDAFMVTDKIVLFLAKQPR